MYCCDPYRNSVVYIISTDDLGNYSVTLTRYNPNWNKTTFNISWYFSGNVINITDNFQVDHSYEYYMPISVQLRNNDTGEILNYSANIFTSMKIKSSRT